ncbi:MAG: UDP-glucose:undecaprenyl-phosphate glucose-1-phosphate transferase [Chlamydiae bacterium]|nr:UDP-glucose:undecaprenyl-phosphate glucose-1-phosphate transferase [Chlamydiota bacterium]
MAIFGKRVFDICFSVFFLILGSPLYFLLFLLVKLTSKGPAIYKSLRMGQNGKLIWCWKFRTMIIDADQKLAILLEKNPEMRKEWKAFHKLKNDPRLTKIGIFLRKTSLDELPQFWNVLKGDISIVGPRPIDIRKPENAREEIRSKYHERTEKILSIRPGITCLWQIKGRNHLTFEQRAALEEEYVNTRNFWLDLKIICKTVYIVLFPKGAY